MKIGRGETRPSRGVIGALTAGFEMLAQNLQVVALPVVLDLILWLGPQVSVAPLMDGFSSILARQPVGDAEMAGQVDQAIGLLQDFGKRFNLISLVGGVPMFQVPSLLARRAPAAGSPFGAPQVLTISNVLALFPWWLALGLVGLVLGYLYVNEIARQVTDVEESGRAPTRNPGAVESNGQVPGEPNGIWKFLRFFGFAVGLMLAGSVVLPLWVLTVALGAAIAQPLGVLLWIGGAGTVGYAVLHLLFVIPSLLVGGRPLLQAVGESVLLSHVNLSSVFGFVLLALVIYEGLGYAWSLPQSDSWALLIGIVGNAFVATGLVGAAFFFYHDRLVEGQQLMIEED